MVALVAPIRGHNHDHSRVHLHERNYEGKWILDRRRGRFHQISVSAVASAPVACCWAASRPCSVTFGGRKVSRNLP